MKTQCLLALAMLCGSMGCSGLPGIITKRAQEECCPTDVRQVHRWLWGEDAIVATPCGPDEAYHGHKPTCWRDWQAPATVWRDEYCGGPPANHADHVASPEIVAPVEPNSVTVPDGADQLELQLDSPPSTDIESLPPAPTLSPLEVPLPTQGAAASRGDVDIKPRAALVVAGRTEPAVNSASSPTIAAPRQQAEVLLSVDAIPANRSEKTVRAKLSDSESTIAIAEIPALRRLPKIEVKSQAVRSRDEKPATPAKVAWKSVTPSQNRSSAGHLFFTR